MWTVGDASIAVVLASFMILFCLALYRLLRPHFQAQVTCWFCNAKSVVPYGNRNCWDCLLCDQYNGFSADGDYNKAIPAQYVEDLNHPVTGGDNRDQYWQAHNGLCEACNRNQHLKMCQLANFAPYDEGNFDAEVDAFAKHLENVYQLCSPCQARVESTLQRQDAVLRTRLLNVRLQKTASERSYTPTGQDHGLQQPLSFLKTSAHALSCASAACAFLLAATHVVRLLCAAAASLASSGPSGGVGLPGRLPLSWDASISVLLQYSEHLQSRHSGTLASVGLCTRLVAMLLGGWHWVRLPCVLSATSWLALMLAYGIGTTTVQWLLPQLNEGAVPVLHKYASAILAVATLSSMMSFSRGSSESLGPHSLRLSRVASRAERSFASKSSTDSSTSSVHENGDGGAVDVSSMCSNSIMRGSCSGIATLQPPFDFQSRFGSLHLSGVTDHGLTSRIPGGSSSVFSVPTTLGRNGRGSRRAVHSPLLHGGQIGCYAASEHETGGMADTMRGSSCSLAASTLLQPSKFDQLAQQHGAPAGCAPSNAPANGMSRSGVASQARAGRRRRSTCNRGDSSAIFPSDHYQAANPSAAVTQSTAADVATARSTCLLEGSSHAAIGLQKVDRPFIVKFLVGVSIGLNITVAVLLLRHYVFS